jgi:hypothetical protein
VTQIAAPAKAAFDRQSGGRPAVRRARLTSTTAMARNPAASMVMTRTLFA